MKDALGHGSAAHQVGIDQIPAGLHSAPSFLDYARGKFGGNYVIARPTEKNRERYPDHRFVTPSQHSRVKAQYRQDHPEAAQQYFGG